MNEKLLDALFTRRKEAVTRLALCLSFSALLAIAARIPSLFVSLPAAWISGGLSVAFIWVIGPPVLIILQAYAIHGLSEAEQLRLLLSSQSTGNLVTPSNDFGDELTPIWRKSFPPILHLAFVLTVLAPTIATCVLFNSYLDLVRPAANGEPMYATRMGQIADAFVGRGGWQGFFPMAPSLQSNLQKAEQLAKPDEKPKYQMLANAMPWTYFPFQTWAYVFLIVLSLHGAFAAIAYMNGTSHRIRSGSLQRVQKQPKKPDQQKGIDTEARPAAVDHEVTHE